MRFSRENIWGRANDFGKGRLSSARSELVEEGGVSLQATDLAARRSDTGMLLLILGIEHREDQDSVHELCAS